MATDLRGPRNRRSLGRRLALVLALCVLAVVVVFAGVAVYRAAAVGRTALALRQGARAVWYGLSGASSEADPPLEDIRLFRRELERLERDVRALSRWVIPVARPIARQGWWPWLSSIGVLVEEGLSAAVDLSAAAWWTALSLESQAENHGQVNTASGVPLRMEADLASAALDALAKNRPRLLRARDALARASEAASRVAPSLPKGGAWGPYLAMAPSLVDALLIAPSALGGSEERTWLVLVQNSDELRPTGGFISSVVTLKTRGPRLVSWRYMNSYEVEAYYGAHPPAPAPLREVMGAAVLLFRDGNWSPDFPTSAEVLAALYQLDMGERVDGAVAIDTHFVQRVLSATGPIAVPAYNATVTSDNVIETVIAFWERPLEAPSIAEREQKHGEWLAHRKDFGQALIEAGIYQLSRLRGASLVALAQSASESIRGKRLFVWALEDPPLQEDLRRAGLDGGVKASPGDYVMAVDANVGWNKADRHIERGILYDVALAGDAPRARLCLTYRHTATSGPAECVHRALYEDTYLALTEQCYWNYLRVLAPSGSALLGAAGSERPVVAGTESGKASFGGLLVAPPGEERHLCLEYTLPASVVRREGSDRVYELLLQKQAGTANTRAAVRVTLPEGSRPTAHEGGWRFPSRAEARWSGTLNADVSLRLSWTEGR